MSNKSFVYLQEKTKNDDNTKVFDSNYMTNEMVSGKMYTHATIYGKLNTTGIFGLRGESEKQKVAMTVCRIPPTVTIGIQKLNLMLDPSKTRDREKKIEVDHICEFNNEAHKLARFNKLYSIVNFASETF